MATIDEKEILAHRGDKLHVRVRIDGVDYFRKCGNSRSTDPADQQAALDRVAENLRQNVEESKTEQATEEVRDGIGDWAAMPEGKEKRDVAKRAMRDVIDLAREGKRLQKDGKTRPQAAEKYMSTRRYKDRIWDQLPGTHAEKATYLALDGPGAGTVYGELKGYMDDLDAANPDWQAVITFMANCTNPIRQKE